MRSYYPRTMSTQHPDNARVPDWASGSVIQGEDEVYEAFYAFSRLGVHEVMWDSEGKDVDQHVVRKLLERFPEFFRGKRLGVDVFLTYRVPNPLIEGADRKVFMETIDSIPTSCDVARAFYRDNGQCPVFEVIVPMTTDHRLPVSVALYYRKVVVEREGVVLADGIRVSDLVGGIEPKNIEVIPLVEDEPSILSVRRIVSETARTLDKEEMRVFIARSDPAMNYGLVPAVLLAKFAVSELFSLSRDEGLDVYPIIGMGSLPFRGGFSPETVEEKISEYAGYYTFTVQSAFRYDYPENVVRRAVEMVNESSLSMPRLLEKSDMAVLSSVLSKLIREYQLRIEALAPLINLVAELIPKRRARKLHVGLFGYSRSVGRVRLPRAIPFVGSLYSVGLPPELIGLSALSKLTEEEYSLVEELYVGLRGDISRAFSYYSPSIWSYIDRLIDLDEKVRSYLLEDLRYAEDILGARPSEGFEVRKHVVLSELLLLCLKEGRLDEAKKYVEEMALLRRSLG